jgi:hypothetical protein
LIAAKQGRAGALLLLNLLLIRRHLIFSSIVRYPDPHCHAHGLSASLHTRMHPHQMSVAVPSLHNLQMHLFLNVHDIALGIGCP